MGPRFLPTLALSPLNNQFTNMVMWYLHTVYTELGNLEQQRIHLEYSDFRVVVDALHSTVIGRRYW